MVTTIENSKNSGGEAAGNGSVGIISDRQQHALFVAAYMITDIVSGDSQRRQFLMDVCLSFTTSVLNDYCKAGVKFVPENDWAKEWARRTGIIPVDKVSETEMDDYIDELEDLKPKPSEELLRLREELRQAIKIRDDSRREVEELRSELNDR